MLLAALMVSACQTQTFTSQSQTAELTASTLTKPVATKTVEPEMLISDRGIGKAKLGMTLGQLREISAPDTRFEVVRSFAENVDAIAVSQKGIVQYYILYDVENNSEAGSAISLEDRIITSLMTRNDNYQTKEGVKVGTPIETAEEIYGNAALAYNIEGQSQEFITFGSKNPENIKFRASYFKLISDGLGYSGIYPEYPGVSYTTDKYRNDAAIALIEVSCNSDDCIH